MKLSSRARGNQYGTIDAVLQIVGWSPRSKFEAVLGPSVAEVPAIAAPEPKVEPAAKKMSFSEIIGDDDIPFAWAAALLLPFAMLIADRIA